MVDYEPIIGLETHIQLNTLSKIFCGCKADSWGDPPNVNICPVCTGLPGVLPTLNRAVIEKAVLLAASVDAQEIQPRSYFARKNYFYPDLPKGFQISQYDEPLARGGHLDLDLQDGSVRRVTIQKLHLEEDAGKTIYQQGYRLIDFNRCGVPLVEMVTGPDLRSADEAAQFMIRLRQLVRWIGISEGDMERGHLRADANVSIREAGSQELNPKTEIKNLNSIESVRSAVEAEIERQIREMGSGRRISPWTLQWDEDREALRKMRSKETEADYRYFREPDLLPVDLSDDWRKDILGGLPELPYARRVRFEQEYGLPKYDAEIVTEERSLADYFEAVLASDGLDPKVVSNWVMNEVLRMLRERGIVAEQLELKPDQLAEVIRMVEGGTITGNTGKSLLVKVSQSGKSAKQIVEEEGLAQVSDEEALSPLVEAIIDQNPDQASSYRGGKTALLGWFVGQLMRETGGKANPQLARALFEERLSK